MNLKEIREVINLMNDNGLMEVEIEREGSKVKLKKTAGDVVMTAPVAAHSPVVSSVPSSSPASQDANKVPEGKTDHQEIKSPMVGTFYASPSPDAEPFVKVGDVVEVGQVVAIVEAMKLMNEIKSEIRGRITDRVLENAQPVEFGQVLFLVEAV